MALVEPVMRRVVNARDDQFDAIAVNSMHARWTRTNPRRTEGPPTVRMLLDAAW